ncbi:hypothetical protein A6J60_000415 [Psychrobacter sp. FDAARGOS_221]|nr:hypothetical protein A6J60_000415 [Psychrobacter sp. FDAARGOS_221]
MNLLKTVVNTVNKLFIPPLVGALVLAIAFAISMQFDSLIQSLELPVSAEFISLFKTLYTFYFYYLLVYIPFFIYLTLLKAFGKLSLATVLVSGFVYGLSPLLFSRPGKGVSVDDVVLLTVIVISGVLCAGCYYWLDKKLSR